MQIKYISWYYGKNRDGEALHLVRLIDGKGLLLTDSEMVQKGLATWN